MENPATRPEVKSALSGTTGIDIRKSPTLRTDWIYAAVPLGDGMAARAAASLDEMNSRLSLWWRRSLVGVLLSLAVLFGLSFLVARLLSRPLEMAAATADRYARGDFAHRLPAQGSLEMSRLTESLGAMAMELDAKFKLITRQREEMSAVFEAMSEGVLALDADGRIMLVNKAAENILGLRGDTAGKHIGIAARNPDFGDAVKKTAAAGQPLEREIRIPRDRGGDILAQVHAAPMREDGKIVGILTVIRDVTRLRRLEIMRRDFVANVSHELRTPVTTIQSCLETLIEDSGTGKDEMGTFLEMALRNTRRMGAIIGNLLLLAGMESGANGDSGASARHPVKPVLDDALSLCQGDAEARGVTVNSDCNEETSALMNPQLVTHALVNLLDNAIKYGPEGGVIEVTARHNGDRTEITVRDKGPGIAPQYQSRIFERFFRINGSSRIKEGSGLGLALAKHIALAQDGDITIDSAIGSGSAFTLILPRA
ncbi:MAG: PAS domain-containing protein, partial [Planctomycetota bacterium]|jgi:two-component system phosphate regulon sensor histidine kinase PhoR|nr:PAS domain-containing protein [Planctomycetota bacterium]